MGNPFLKEFDEIFSEILTDWQNQFPEADVSQGSLIYIKSACLSSAIWGIYKYQDWISKQIFPDTASAENMEHHAWVRGLSRKSGETDAELLARLLEYIRRPPAGGNQYDYVKWAMECDGVKAAYCIPLAQGLGTVDVILLASGSNEIPTQDLLDDVKDYIDDVRPVTASVIRVLAPDKITQAVTMTVSGDDVSTDVIEADIETYMDNMIPGEDLALARLTAIAINGGATNVTITVPATDVSADADEIIRPGTIAVST